MKKNDFKFGPYPAAARAVDQSARSKESPQSRSSSYSLAFQDLDFLLRPELRPIRMQLELLKPEFIFQEHQIESTIVIFGSARIPEPELARREYETLYAKFSKDKENKELEKALKLAEKKLENSTYYQESRRLAQLISTHSDPNKLVVITGGGPGVMAAANRGAHDAGSKSIGLNIVLEHEQFPNEYITPEFSFQFHYFAARKMHFLSRAKGLIVFPGGFGTMDELFETLTLLQTKKIEDLPIILFGEKFWSKVINFQAMVEEGTISEEDLNLFHYVEKASEAWEILSRHNGLD